MSKFLTGIVVAGALLAASSGLATAADYPPCKSRSDDKCMQVPAGAMKMEMKEEMGGEMMKKEMGGETMEKSMNGMSDIPHGCSPATTPCQ